MYKSFIFWCILISFIFKSNQSNLDNKKLSHHKLLNESNYFHHSINQNYSFEYTADQSNGQNNSFQYTADQLALINLVNKSNQFNLDNLDYKRFKKFENNNKNNSINQIKLKNSLKTNLENIFYKIYKSNYSHFCPCPPKLKNANHNLQDLLNDNNECIYLPLTTVEYYCNKKSIKQNNFQNKIIFNRLICELNSDKNELNWIIDVDDKLNDLDEILVYRDDQFSNDNDKEINEDLEIRLQSISLSEFNIQFLNCELNKTDIDLSSSKLNYSLIRSSENHSLIRSSEYHSLIRSSENHSKLFKRSYSLERNIEILIVIDILMNKYHGNNLENYIYTIMSTVSSIYKDSSIGNNINIAIVQIILLNEKETKQLITNSASITLERFCKWQSNLNSDKNDEHPFYHDIAILLTRTDLCRSDKNCDTLGLAHSSKMCTNLSCSVVEDNGLSTAFTIVHEIGHALGIPHDQDEKCRRLNKDDDQNGNQFEQQYSIMGKMLDFSSNPFKWSSCSAYFVTEFFDSGKADCLLDKPKRNFLDFVNMNNVTEEEISKNYEGLLKTKSISDKRLLSLLKNNRIERERRDHRSHFQLHNRNGRNKNSFFYEMEFKKNNLLPGQYFNPDLQCQLIFGSESKICPYMTPCKHLWCTSGLTTKLNLLLENNNNLSNNYYSSFRKRQETIANYKFDDTGCKTQHIPWAEGTPCGDYLNEADSNYLNDDFWCIKGECISKQIHLKNNLYKVNGGWSEWQNWSNCSRKCGGGIQSSFRLCNNPEPKNGGSFCVGQRQRYKSCNIFKCPKNEIDFRDEQCAYFNNKILKNLPSNEIWKSVQSNNDDDLCKLYCKVEKTGAQFLLKNKVIDGTDCLENGKCVNGLCVNSGCDNVIYSKKVLDECGVCGGDNSTCNLIEGKFNQAVNYGYNFVVKIPAGSMNVIIKQLNGNTDDDNSLALRLNNGSYLINGNAIISNYERIVDNEGVKIFYTGTGILNYTDQQTNNEENEIENTIDNQNVENDYEKQYLTLSNNEKKLREEYNKQLNDLKMSRLNYSADSIHRLYDKQHKIKEYRQQLQNLIKQKLVNKFIPNKEIKKIKKIKLDKFKKRSFIESISIRQPIKVDLYVEVLSVGNLEIPEIEYKYSILNNKLNDLNLIKDKKLIDQLNIFNNSKNNSINNESSFKRRNLDDKLIKHVQNNQQINYKTVINSQSNQINKQNRLKSTKFSQKESNKLNVKSLANFNQTKNQSRFKKFNIKIGKNLKIKKGTKEIRIKCPSDNKFISNTKWFKNEKEITFLKSFNLLDSNNLIDQIKLTNKSIDNSSENKSINQSIRNQSVNKKSKHRYHLTKRGTLVINNLKKIDSGIYTCLFSNDYTQLIII